MSNLYESKFMQKVKSIGEKCAGNKAIAAVSAGMMMAYTFSHTNFSFVQKYT